MQFPIVWLETGQKFTFPGRPQYVYVYRGNGWYSSEVGSDGGPWHADGDTPIVPTFERLTVADTSHDGIFA